MRWKVRTGVLGEAPDTGPVRSLRDEVRSSPRVAALLSGHADQRPYATPSG